MTLILILAVLCFVASLVVLAETATPTARKRASAVALVRRFGGLPSRRPQTQAPAIATAERFGSQLASEKFRKALPQRLAAAGLAGRVTPEALIALRAGLVALGVLVGLCLGAVVTSSSSKTVALAIAFGGLACMAPSYVLDRKARSRRAKIHAALPDALDLLAVTVEAGLGLYGAIQRLVETSDGPLADELALVLTELRVGDSSERALKRMAERMQSPEVASLVRSLIQGEQLGLSLARTLRNLAEDTRNRRRAVAEELAAKAPVKMLVPTALFIFPALFVVILGPALLEVSRYL